MARVAVLLFLLISIPTLSGAQAVPISDPQAVSIAAKSMAAMTGGVVVGDISFGATVTSNAGSDNQTGTGQFLAKGLSESRVVLTLSEGTRTEIRNSSTGVPSGSWSGKTSSGAISQHNCWTDAAWFAPTLSSLSGSDPTVVLSFLGQEEHGGISVLHLSSYRYIQTKDPLVTTLLQKASRMDFYLDPSSLLPFAIAFNTHPDDDINTDISVEIRFADYRPINGVNVPFRIQRLLNGSFWMDIAVTNVILNSGLVDTTFSIRKGASL